MGSISWPDECGHIGVALIPDGAATAAVQAKKPTAAVRSIHVIGWHTFARINVSPLTQAVDSLTGRMQFTPRSGGLGLHTRAPLRRHLWLVPKNKDEGPHNGFK